MMRRGFILQTSVVFVASFVLATVESQTVTVFPPRVGAQNGQQNVVLGCNVTGTNIFVEWVYFPAWKPTGFTIYSSYSNISHDQSNFTISRAGQIGETQSVDLVINTAYPPLATQYICRLTPVGYEAAVDVIVLDQTECPNTEMEYDELNEANISCSVNYYDSSLINNPTITWQRDGIDVPGVIQIDESPNRKTARLTKNVTSVDDNQEFVCVVYFPDSNPDYTDNCSTSFYVRHGVSEISFNPPSSVENPTLVIVGETINCTANGRPEPTIEWYDSQENLLSTQSGLLVTDDMLYWSQPITLYCRANNTLDNGVTFSGAEGNYTFTVDNAVPIVSTGGVEGWVIAVIVIVSVLAIAGIAVAIFFIVRHHKKKKVKKAKTTNGSAAARPTTTTTTTTAYTAVPGNDVIRPPPTSAPRTTGSITSNQGPPGPDNRNGLGGYGENPGFGDLGVQTYRGSNQAVNAYPPANRSVHGSNQALGVSGIGVSMNPNPGYPVRSNPALNASNQRPAYPYTGSNSALNTSLSGVGGQHAVAPSGASYGRQPSIASSSGRSHASSYNAAIPAMEMNRYPVDLSSMHGSEV